MPQRSRLRHWWPRRSSLWSRRGEEKVMQVVVKAPKPADHSLPINLADDEDDETVHATVESEDNYKANAPRRSKRLQGRCD
uniref:Uncharacterized protein n=1 Tax=Hordeum vulgare subsp. vulgare TaxID=112509 RepID=A0A023INK2_HORVV|nr:hypothetical protein [Hordeum vulgare subsp. vulgare]QGH59156.1 hypothetical protein [Hordeum vulgare subsp. vulgare]